MPPKQNQSFSAESFIYRGVYCILIYLFFKLQVIKDIFGPYILIAGIINATVGYICFLIGGIKSLRFFSRVAKAMEEIKKGEEEGEEKEE